MRANERLEGPVLPEESVQSTGIRWIRYDERARTLDVAFVSSGEYRYERLTAEPASSEDGDLERLLRDSLQSPSNSDS